MNDITIKRIYCKIPISQKSHKMSLSSDEYNIEYIPEMQGYLIDKTILIHVSNINEVIVETKLAIEKKKKV